MDGPPQKAKTQRIDLELCLSEQQCVDPDLLAIPRLSNPVPPSSPSQHGLHRNRIWTRLWPQCQT